MKEVEFIKIRGARKHNLKNIDVNIQINKITCIAGPSGSGKSSLAFHTLLSESKRRFINSLPTDMKFFWEAGLSAEVDSIYPVLPAWGLPQHNPILNSRPVALDVLGGHERIQRVFFELGEYLCPEHQCSLFKSSSLEQKLKEMKKKKLKEDEVIHLFCKRETYLRDVSSELMPSRSFSISNKLNSFNEDDDWYELFRVKLKDFDLIYKKLSEARLKKEEELLVYFLKAEKEEVLADQVVFNCPECDFSLKDNKESSMESLSPLNALGACSECEGHGANLVYDREKLVKDPTKTIKEGAINFLSFSHFAPLFATFLKEATKAGFDINLPFEKQPAKIWKFLYEGGGKYEGFNEYFEYLKSQRYKKNIRIYMRSLQTEHLCETCEGTRISKKSSNLNLILKKTKLSYKDFLKKDFSQSQVLLEEIKNELGKELKDVKLLSTYEKLEKLYRVANDLGLGHLKNTRKVKSLSTSEYQRILLSKYLSYEGSQSLFVLDEPSLGLSLKIQEKLVKYLEELKEQGNTILLVEHSEYLKSKSDEVIVMGPLAGGRGGEILSQGKYQKHKEVMTINDYDLVAPVHFIELSEASIRGLSKKEILIGKDCINWAIGESGSGKSSFLVDIVANEVHRSIYGTRKSFEQYQFKKLKGIKDLTDVIVIDSSLDKISSRSTLATYTDLGVFVRKYFASLPVSKNLNLKEGHFSSNSELGQCSSCEGRGVKVVEMHFMEDMVFTCEDCQGKKLKPYYANISDGNLTVHEAFSLPLSEVLGHIKLTPKGKRIWEYFKILKLDYLALDRTLISLSGGERQRLQLLSLLDKKTQGALIIFENVTSGLSHHEFPPLAELLWQLSTSGNTVVVIDQNPFFKKIAQHQIHFN